LLLHEAIQNDSAELSIMHMEFYIFSWKIQWYKNLCCVYYVR